MDHGAPQRFHTRTRLLPVLVPTPRPAAGPGARSRATLDYRGILPVRQGPSRTRRTPSTHLDLVAPLGDPVHARHGLPGRHLRQRTRRHTHPARPDSVHPQRDSAPLRQTRPRPHCHRRQHLGLVTLATKTPGHRTLPSLSAQVRTPMNPIYNCSTSGVSPQPDEACLWSPVWGAPAGRGETVTGKPGPVYEPPMRLVGLNRPPE